MNDAQTPPTRPLRFRMWNTVTKEMLPEVGNLRFLRGELTGITAGQANNWLKHGYYDIGKEDLDKVVLMQSTGLNDKNGKEIFEGDIVQASEDDEGVRLCRPEEVSYGQGGFYPFCIPCHGGDTSWEVYGPRYRVLGNIYEHPHLLSA